VTAHVLPALDCHAHIAPDVTQRQLAALGDAHIFAMTRSLDEAEDVAGRQDPTLTWGLGVHPGVASARANFDSDRFRGLLPRFAIVGEVGLDRRAPRQDGQRIFANILQACDSQPVLISVHSAGRIADVVDLIERYPHPGLMLHWFLGDPGEIARALSVGAHFSVNAAMSADILSAIPRDRMLPETDFPARQVRARLPGAVATLEEKLAAVWGGSIADVRTQLWRNLKTIAISSGAIETLPEGLTDTLVAC
jgi:TatD DNase family protein